MTVAELLSDKPLDTMTALEIASLGVPGGALAGLGVKGLSRLAPRLAGRVTLPRPRNRGPLAQSRYVAQTALGIGARGKALTRGREDVRELRQRREAREELERLLRGPRRRITHGRRR